MAYDLEEQEQIAKLKTWWDEHGKLVILVAVAALLTIAAVRGWHYYRQSQALAAVVLYDQMEEAVHAGDHKKVRDIAAQITDKYGTTPYATMAALSSARAAFTGGDLEAARTQLQWVLDRGREDEIKDVARLRLAGVLLDEKKHDEALKLLEVKPADSLAGLYADLKGDILVTQGKIPEARGAYQAALDQSERGSTYRATIQLKLDALGEAPVAKQ
jgi:predicted negative regulator of RcsB-dependent stress response